ncbi:hypothetical protein OESDEN_08660 [Oesophagostomum dentatum]|uniref:Integrase catalytic domain-containing protein n=1 Tax=Oesophagostomum dentatum TaxID=61180 RepID=A0A0B1T7W2_OESDE|nr:hypothetical protein OESDEN_08660 [Oesophagostomum dentatum]
MSTRALHLEVVADNTTIQFILAFRCFIARRGTPDQVISDNAPTFKLGMEVISNDLIKIVQGQEITDFIAEQGINWHFITLYSPWKGGFYERLVGSVKACLKKSIRNKILDFWLFETLIFEIEATLNTRPLFPVASGDVNSSMVTRPIGLINPQFRLGRLSETVPARLATSSNTTYQSLTTYYHELEATIRYFWTLWQNEYLAALAEKSAKYTNNEAFTRRWPRIGDVVLIRQENVPRSTGPIGLITHINKTEDGCPRAARIRVAQRKMINRSTKQLNPLEICAADDEDFETRPKIKTPTRVQPPKRTKSAPANSLNCV